MKATPTADELEEGDRESAVFELLFKTIQPTVLFIHGKEVKDYFEKIFNISLIKDEVNNIELLGIPAKIIPMNHLSRGWSRAKATETGERINKLISDHLQNDSNI